MFIRWLLAALHLLGMGIALGSSYARFRAFKAPLTLDAAALSRVFHADNWWGISVLILLPTGLLRAFAGFEKGAAWYLHNGLFHAKLGLFLTIFALEILPMITLIRWRRAARAGQAVDTSRAPTFARISLLQAHLLVLMVLAAVAMARSIGL